MLWSQPLVRATCWGGSRVQHTHLSSTWKGWFLYHGPKSSTNTNDKLTTSFFQVTLLSPKWGSLNPRKGHLKRPKGSLGRTWNNKLFLLIYSTSFQLFGQFLGGANRIFTKRHQGGNHPREIPFALIQRWLKRRLGECGGLEYRNRKIVFIFWGCKLWAISLYILYISVYVIVYSTDIYKYTQSSSCVSIICIYKYIFYISPSMRMFLNGKKCQEYHHLQDWDAQGGTNLLPANSPIGHFTLLRYGAENMKLK